MTKVIVVEDSIVIAKAIKIILGSEDIEVEHVINSHKAVETISSQKPSLVILDLMMPGVSGIDIFKELKAKSDTKSIPVLILSAKTDAMKWYEELKDCDKFMKKPFDNDELLKSVKELIKCAKCKV
jgi:two-component system phosphate regulon response regulator PhoB